MSGADRTDVLVVGAGQAGLQVAVSLREGGYDARVVLLGRELHPPYQRPPLSKGFVKGATPDHALVLKTPEFYEERGIELALGADVVDVRVQPGGTGEARCSDGGRYAFGRLVLATGAEARDLVLEGCDAQGVHRLRDLQDAVRLRQDLEAARSVVVLGGGFLGLELAASARAMGKNVTVVEAGPTVLGRTVGSTTAEHVLRAHEETGIRVLLSTTAKRVRVESGRAVGVDLEDGTSVPADVVVVAVGARPRVELAVQAGLLCADGVVVDRHMRASDGTTLAVGDCTSVPDPTCSEAPRRLRLESVDSAVAQAQAAAATVLGVPSPYRGVPWFWSDQGDVKLQVAGLSHGADSCVVRRYPDPRRLTVVHYRRGVMVAAEAVNAPAEVMAVRRALEQGVSLPQQQVRDAGVPLKSLLSEQLADRLTG